MKITILSRLDFKNLLRSFKVMQHEGGTLEPNVYIISIHSDSVVLTPEVLNTFKAIGVKDSLSMDFDDITPEDLHEEYENFNRSSSRVRQSGDLLCFNEDHANTVVEFMKKIRASETDETLKETHVIIHCFAGISRSGAVGMSFLDSQYFKRHIDAHQFCQENPQIVPNYHIRALIMRKLYAELQQEQTPEI